MIRTLEELSMNAWPARQTQVEDGWVLRFADGYTRRANSIYPLYPAKFATLAKIRTCEKIYQDKGLPLTFKMTTASFPPDLDDILAKEGYQIDVSSSVQVLELDAPMELPPKEVSLTVEVTREWLAAYGRMNKLKAEFKATHEYILRAIVPSKQFASISVDGQIIACGVGVVENGWMGFYDIIIDPDFRRRGFAQKLMQGLLVWGKIQGATRGYLQVMLTNPAALALYAKLGFREEYRYWFRVKR